MSAHTAALTSGGLTKMTMNQLLAGGHTGRGVKWSTFTFTGSSSYDAGGSTLDLSSICPNRVFAVILPGSMKNASHAHIQINYIPGTAKTDKVGGFAPTDGKVSCSAGATATSGSTDTSGYSCTGWVLGY